MSDYNEHLISMAGGGGDVLGDIEARIASDRDDFADGYSDQSIRDRAALVAMVKAHEARIGKALDLAAWAGRHGWTIDAAAIRVALEPTA
jgi:hypothetical protein